MSGAGSGVDLALGALIDFMTFLETIAFRTEAASSGSLSGRHFAADMPAGWVVIDATELSPTVAEAAVSGLTDEVAREVRAHLVEHEGSHLLYLSLPDRAEPYIAVTVACSEPGLSPERWESQALTGLDRANVIHSRNGSRATIVGREYRLYDITRFPDGGGRRVDKLAMPVSTDGCGHTFTLTPSWGTPRRTSCSSASSRRCGSVRGSSPFRLRLMRELLKHHSRWRPRAGCATGSCCARLSVW